MVCSHLHRKGEGVEPGKLVSNRDALTQSLKDKVGRQRTRIAPEANRSSLWVYQMLVEQLRESARQLDDW